MSSASFAVADIIALHVTTRATLSVQAVIMYLNKGPQELQMQLCHKWPACVDEVIRGHGARRT